MKTISTALQEHLGGELTTLVELVKITRTDGVIKAFTTHDADLVVDGVTYKADGSFSPQDLNSAASLKAERFEIAGVLDSAVISDTDLKAGLYDHARIDFYVCNWADLTQGVIQLRRGWIGEVLLEDGRYTAELRGFHDLLQRRIGETYTPECRYDLGDSRCGIDLAALTVTGSVTGATSASVFSDTARTESDGTFAYGKLTWTSGANQGLGMEVQDWNATDKTFTLWLPMPNAIATGDGYSVYPGCDKRLACCRDTFNNVINFGGFPHLPGVGKILFYPDNKG